MTAPSATLTRAAAAQAAADKLTTALVNLGARGLRTHCSDAESHHLWLSDRLRLEEEPGQLPNSENTGCPVAPRLAERWPKIIRRTEFGMVSGQITPILKKKRP